MAMAAALLMQGCVDDEPKLSDIAMYITPGADTEVTLASGEKERYEMKISTIHDYVASLKISSFDKYNGEIVWQDTKLTEKAVECQFVFTAPEIPSESAEVTLTFTATDNFGHVTTVKRLITVTNRMVSLPEKSGIVLYPEGSGMPDAIALADVARPFCLADSPTPEDADIYMTADEGFSNIAWHSNTKLKFLRNNTFNYVEATAQSISAVYASSTREDMVTNLQVNDIIIVGHGSMAEGVFMVTNILHGQGVPDCVQLSYKGIGRESTEPSGTDSDPSDSTGE